MHTEEPLSQLRREIEETTRGIFFLVARRLEMAREIGRIKARRGIPISLPQVEKKLRGRLLGEFDELEVNRKFGNKILDALLSESKRLQLQSLNQESRLAESSGNLPSRKAAVIGGAGSMGVWLTKRLDRMGYKVTIYDLSIARAKKIANNLGVNVAPDLSRAVRGSQVVFLSVPIRAMTGIVHAVVEKAERGATIVEICSLKSRVHKKLREVRRKDLTLLSIHPLFGPKTSGLTNKTIALCPVRDRDQEVKVAKELFKRARIVFVSPVDHDNAMGILLSLTHLASLAFSSSCLGTDSSVIQKLPTTSFRLHLLAASSVLSENPDLFASILMENPESLRVLTMFEGNFSRLAKMVRKNDASDIRLEFSRVRNSLTKIFSVDELYHSSRLILESMKI